MEVMGRRRSRATILRGTSSYFKAPVKKEIPPNIQHTILLNPATSPSGAKQAEPGLTCQP